MIKTMGINENNIVALRVRQLYEDEWIVEIFPLHGQPFVIASRTTEEAADQVFANLVRKESPL